MKNNTISIDLAKNVFQVMEITASQKVLFNKRLNRSKLRKLMQSHEPYRVVMEACYSSNYWGRVFNAMGHSVELIPAQHVKPFVRGNKNDPNDTLAIFEASNRPNIRAVPVKTEAQQEILMLHRLRERLLRAKIAASNQARGLLVDFGLIIPAGHKAFEEAMIEISTDEQQRTLIRYLTHDVLLEFRELKTRLAEIEKKLIAYAKTSTAGQILLSIPGVGIIIASAFIASIGTGQAFNNAKEFAVWLGLTPKQAASGNKSVMLSISKRGDCYLRKQLIHGARTVVMHAGKKNDALNHWINKLRERKSFNCTTVATAHRLARLMWVLLQKQSTYSPQVVQQSV